MNRFKKSDIRSLALIGSAAVLAVIGSTLAYFSSADDVTNSFSSEQLDIVLTEPNWKPSSGMDALPGDILTKDPRIINKVNAPAFVFLRVSIPCGLTDIENDTGEGKGTVRSVGRAYPMYKFCNGSGEYDSTDTLAQLTNSGWTLVGEPKVVEAEDGAARRAEYIYGYTELGRLKSLGEGEITPTLFDRVKVCNFNEDYTGTDNNIAIKAYGIQTILLGVDDPDPEEVWKLIGAGR